MKKEMDDFDKFYHDDTHVSPEERAEIEFEADLIEQMIEAREKSGMTQRELAEASGLKQSAIARIETMRSIPRIDTLGKMLAPMGYKIAIVPIH